LGAAIAPLPDSTRAAQHVPAGQGVLIANILPGLSAESGGLKAGDILTALDRKPIADARVVVAAVRAHRIGDTIAAEYLRDGAPLKAQITLKGLPYETAEDFDVSYEAVDVGDSTRRVIITKPRDAGRHPAVLMIGGIGCYSYDAGNNDDDAYRKLLYALTRRGFVTLRIEKSGMGDSTGAPCAEVDMQTELNGYVAGLHMLKAKSYVDAQRAFVVGHSIGGVVGPLAAAKEQVRGILAMETTGLTWFEYELSNARRQLKLAGIAPDFVTGAEESKAIVDDVNTVRAGAATYIEIPDMDHYLTQTADQAASLQRLHTQGHAEFHPRLAQIVGDWLEGKSG
jgi:alpha/beta superfamily hydrolase